MCWENGRTRVQPWRIELAITHFPPSPQTAEAKEGQKRQPGLEQVTFVLIFFHLYLDTKQETLLPRIRRRRNHPLRQTSEKARQTDRKPCTCATSTQTQNPKTCAKTTRLRRKRRGNARGVAPSSCAPIPSYTSLPESRSDEKARSPQESTTHKPTRRQNIPGTGDGGPGGMTLPLLPPSPTRDNLTYIRVQFAGYREERSMRRVYSTSLRVSHGAVASHFCRGLLMVKTPSVFMQTGTSGFLHHIPI